MVKRILQEKQRATCSHITTLFVISMMCFSWYRKKMILVILLISPYFATLLYNINLEIKGNVWLNGINSLLELIKIWTGYVMLF